MTRVHSDAESVSVPTEKVDKPAADVKRFDPAVLGAFTTGILMTEFDPVHEAAEWLAGHPVWTHELPMFSETLKAAALKQFPNLPTEAGADWQATRDAIRAHYGDAVDVARGHLFRPADPFTTATAAITKARGGLS